MCLVEDGCRTLGFCRWDSDGVVTTGLEEVAIIFIAPIVDIFLRQIGNLLMTIGGLE